MITFISCRCSTCDVMIIVGFSQAIIVSTIFFSSFLPWFHAEIPMLHPFSIMLLKLDEPIPINPLSSPMFSYVLIRINPYVYPYGYGIFHLNSARSHGSHSSHGHQGHDITAVETNLEESKAKITSDTDQVPWKMLSTLERW